MHRSSKPSLKEKIVVKKLDEETQDQITYLGLPYEELAAQGLEAANQQNWYLYNIMFKKYL